MFARNFALKTQRFKPKNSNSKLQTFRPSYFQPKYSFNSNATQTSLISFERKFYNHVKKEDNFDWIALGVGLGLASLFLLDNNAEEKEDSNSFFQNIKGNYEKRIRELSSPEKVFEYFASDKRGSKVHECFMTPSDFLRSISPFSVNHPMNEQTNQLNEKYLQNILQVIDVNGDGLISFEEFLLLTGLLSIPQKHASIAFRFFDEDGNDELDKKEFSKFLNFIQQSNPLHQFERTSVIHKSNEGDNETFVGFFGKDAKKTISLNQFTNFLQNVKDSILHMQFNLLSEGNLDSMTMKNFATSIISYGDIRQQQQIVQRVNTIPHPSATISYSEFTAFHTSLQYLDEIDYTLRRFISLDKSFNQQQLKKAISVAAGVKLSDHQLDVIFHLFDKDGDGLLDYEEFIGTLRGNSSFGITKPRDLGFWRFTSCISSCWKSEVVDRGARS